MLKMKRKYLQLLHGTYGALGGLYACMPLLQSVVCVPQDLLTKPGILNRVLQHAMLYNLNVAFLHSSDTIQTPPTLLISSVRQLLQVEQRSEFIQMHLNSILKIAGAQCPQTDEKHRVNLEYSLTSVVLRQQSAPLQGKAITISLTACGNH